MRYLSIRLLPVFLSLLALGCNIPDDGEHVAPITTYEAIHGEWSLMNLTMVDELAKANSIKPDEQNLSTMFNYENFRIRLDVDDTMQPTTYEVLGDVPPLFQLEGYWELNTEFQPTNNSDVMILLYTDEEKTVLADKLRLSSVPRSNREMEIQLVRTSGGTPFVSYVFKLIAE